VSRKIAKRIAESLTSSPELKRELEARAATLTKPDLERIRAELRRRDAKNDRPVDSGQSWPALPVVGERWIHRRNKRVIKVLAVLSTVDGSRPTHLIRFVYSRDRAGDDGLGWRRGITPPQEMMIDQWRTFFTERAP
jgi:hypothetical protein